MNILAASAIMVVVVGIAPIASAKDISVSGALSRCLTEALAADRYVELIEPDGKPARHASVMLMCEGQPAERLFTAIDRLAVEEMRGGVISRRVAKSMHCSRLPSQHHYCTVAIETTPDFVDAMR